MVGCIKGRNGEIRPTIHNVIGETMRPFHYDEQAAQKEFDEQVSLGNSIYWLKAVIEQGSRIFKAAEQPTIHVNSEIHNSRSMMEEQFFLTACEKAQRWTNSLKLESPEADHFSNLGEDFKKVRDEREHDDERYGLGGKYNLSEVDPQEHAERGHILKSEERRHKYQKFRMEKADTAGGVTIHTTMSGTIHSGGRILLGGIVDVAQVVKAAEVLVESLLPEQHAYWDSRIARTPGTDTENAKVAESYHIEARFK